MSAYEEQTEIVREDGVTLPGIWIDPDGEAAHARKGAGVVVVGGERGLRQADRDRFVTPLGDLGYFVIAFDLVRGSPALTDDDAAARARGLDHGIAIDDLAAGILACKQLTSFGRIAVIGIGIAGAIAIEAATMLPHIDAVVHVDGPPPSRTAKLSRLRAAINVHRAESGTRFTAADFEDLERRAKASKAQLLCNTYPTHDGFFTDPRDEEAASQARIAWDRTRDFLGYALG